MAHCLRDALTTKIACDTDSVGLTQKLRDIIEEGPATDLVKTCHNLFDGKIKETKTLAAALVRDYGLMEATRV